MNKTNNHKCPVLPTDTLFNKDIINHLAGHAIEELQTTGGTDGILILKTTKSKKFTGIPLVPSPDGDKTKFFKFIKFMFDNNNEAIEQLGQITEAILISDARMLKTTNNNIPSTSLENNPDAIEAIVVFGRNKTGDKHLLATYPYLRLDNKIQILSDQAEYHEDGNNGRGLLDYIFEDGQLTDYLQSNKDTRIVN